MIAIKNDPVLEWLHRHPDLTPRLDGEVDFHLDLATIRLRSNAPDVLKMAANIFRNYASTGPAQPASLCVDVYHIENTWRFGGFDPYADWDRAVTQDAADILPNTPSSGRVKPIEINGVNCLWRPHDYLASLQDRHTARILTTNPVYGKGAGSPVSKLSMKGTADQPENTPELIDLIKILYVRCCNQCCIHGAAAAWNEQGLVLTGPSGCGKTTTVLSLVRDGFVLLSDELTLIDTHDNGTVRLRGLLVPPMVMGDRLVGLNDLETTLTAENNGSKTPFLLDPSVVRDSRNFAVRPRTIVYLESQSGPRTDHEVSPMPLHTGFGLLSRQVLDLPGNDRRRFHFESLTSLMECARHYRLAPGSDLSSLPALMRNLVAK